MQRREFIKWGGAAAALGVTAAPAVRAAEPQVKWRLVSAFPKSLDTIFGAAEVLARRVREITNGKFDIQVFSAGEIVPGGAAALDAVSAGTVESCHTCSYYSYGKHPAFAIGTAIPFGLDYRQINSWYYLADGQKLLDEFYSAYGVRSFLGGNTGVQMGGWFRKEIKSLADIKGLKMRIAGLAGKVWNGVGAVSQQIPGSDIYPSLEKGTIDAAEWVGPYDDEKLGFHKIAKFYYAPGWWEVGPAIHFFVSLKEWSKLPKEYQAAFEAAAYEANTIMMAMYDLKNPPALARLIGQGVKVKNFPGELMKAFYKSASDVYTQEISSQPAFAKLYQSQQKFQAQSGAWLNVAERPMQSYTLPKL